MSRARRGCIARIGWDSLKTLGWGSVRSASRPMRITETRSHRVRPKKLDEASHRPMVVWRVQLPSSSRWLGVSVFLIRGSGAASGVDWAVQLNRFNRTGIKKPCTGQGWPGTKNPQSPKAAKAACAAAQDPPAAPASAPPNAEAGTPASAVWYLFSPPLSHGGQGQADFTKTLSTWCDSKSRL